MNFYYFDGVQQICMSSVLVLCLELQQTILLAHLK